MSGKKEIVHIDLVGNGVSRKREKIASKGRARKSKSLNLDRQIRGRARSSK